jgi:hypothetical protein
VTRKLLITIIVIAALVGVTAGLLVGAISNSRDAKHYSGRSGQKSYCQDQGWKYDAKSNSCVR